jgi:hypothetical protein
MAVDYWPEQDGIIVKGLICGFCYADNAVNAGEIVKWGTSAVSRIAVTPSTAIGDGVGVALKTASATGDIIPVAFSGIIKMTTSETLSIGNLVINANSLTLVGMNASNKLCLNSNATGQIMGCLMQTGADDNGDEVLVLLGGDGMAVGNV